MVATNTLRRTLAIGVALVALAAAVFVAGGLAGRDDDPTGPTMSGDGAPAGSSTARGTASAGTGLPGSDGPPVILPGRPGEPPRTVSGDQVAPASVRYNAMDIWFVRMMIPHHSQALRMADLARQRAGDPQLRAFADRIWASQLTEIQALRGWLQDRNLELEDPGDGHDHATMPGMQSDAAMRRLAEARGAEFDRLFVEMMTAHHQGAMTMATELLRVGVDETVHALANSIATEQGVEIDRMRELLHAPPPGPPA